MTQIKLSAMPTGQYWVGTTVAYDEQGIKQNLLTLGQPIYIVQNEQGQFGVAVGGTLHPNIVAGGLSVFTHAPAISPSQFGNPDFQTDHHVKYSYMTGAMAGGIASADLVIAMGKAGMLASFGAAGLVPARIQEAIQQIQAAFPSGKPYAFNLIHSPNEEALERNAVRLYLEHGVKTVEASAFLDLTPHVVYYRAAGLSRNPDGSVKIGNRIIAKISRREVATLFMKPAPPRLLTPLVEQGLITQEQADLAQQVPMADDITCEADSGGHTDNRPLVALLPAILALRDEIQAEYRYPTPVRVGAGGGIGTPSAALAAFMMGADYIVTGSINQATMEAGSSLHTKKVLAQADMADVAMAPAADMFEMGVTVQVLKRGTMFPMRAQKLYEYYKTYDSIEAIPADEREKLEKTVFKRPIEDIWQGTVDYFMERDPEQIERANNNPKRKMALIFRWYLGLSSRWSNTGEKGREMDYQIWCGPAMGAFNAWVKGTYLEHYENRHVADIAEHVMLGAAFLYRMQTLKIQGVHFPPHLSVYRPGER
ncbi:MAG: 2-nitropropane dioxygenase [Phototrophicales bacterium]|nr:MAG: 2-nitropropane dioxygenase [Phototrophicales bacterium]RMG74458.1 MAG: PfaD family polyunsaturated fatty acid/polyketide biosynthesis protein [Chloroflexota bacterium]